MLEIKNLTFSYDNKRILFNDASISISKPGLYYLDSRNGTGKSTLFKIIKGIIKTSASVVVNDSINDYTKITYIDYRYVVNNRLSVEDYLKLFCDDDNYINECLNLFMLSHVKKKLPRTLSDGERSRLALVQGILEDNDVILIDEVFSHLDKKSVDLVLDVIYRLSLDKIIIITSHKENFRINADYTLKIYNQKLLLEENNLSHNVTNFVIKKTSINYKKLHKVISFNFRYLYFVFIVFLTILTSYFLYSSKFPEHKVQNEYIKCSNTIPYVVSDVYFNRIENYKHNDLNIIDKSNVKLVSSAYSFYPLIMSYDIKCISPLYDFNVTRIFLTDKYKDTSLNDNEIVITDYLYHVFLINMETLPGNGACEIQNGEMFINFKYFKAKVVQVIDTGFNPSTEIVEIKDKHQSLYFMSPNPFRYNYFYCSLYMNSNTYNKFTEGQVKLLRENELIRGNDKIGATLKLANECVLVDGRYPKSENEILLPINYYKPNDLNNETFISFDSCSKKDLEDEENDLLKHRYYSLSTKKRVVGYTESNTYGFFNQNSIDDLYKSYIKYFEEYAIDINNISEEDLINVNNNSYELMIGNYNEYNKTINKLNNNRKLNNALYYVLLSIIIVSVCLYITAEYLYLYKDLYSIKQKNINSSLINNMIIKFNIKSFMFILIILSFALTVIFSVNLFDKIIYKLLGM